MSKSNYQPIGKYIREVNIRNRGLEVNQLMGLSIEKRFIPSIANTIGTDMSTYRIIKRNQFAYGPVTSRNGEKITIALFQDYDISMIYQAYTVFEIIDTDKLLPEYLMMWFRRLEFDRYARFMSHGSVRELFGWEELCNTTLPVPHIDNQREIVQEYKTITDRIELNKKLCLKLEETAQAIYREWFVDFEFPNEDGKPYKSSGGEMIESELGEIPIGWRVGTLGEIIDYKKGYAFKSSDYMEHGVSIIRVSDLGLKYIDHSQFYKTIPNQDLDSYKVLHSDFIIATVGSWASNPLSVVGKLVRVPTFADGFYLNQNMVRIRIVNEIREIIYQQLIQKTFSDYLISGAQGSANQASITLDHIFKFKVLFPKARNLDLNYEIMYNVIDNKIIENQNLNKLKELLLAKLTKIGGVL